MNLNRIFFYVVLLPFLAGTLAASPATAEIYELRTYTTNEGKLENLHARFRDHTVKLFEKHGMESVGYWVPTDKAKSKNTLIYVLRHQSREAAGKSWSAFIADPAWKKVAKESQLDGQILAKAPESVYMDVADYSPILPIGEDATEEDDDEDENDDAVFELRTYRTNPGKLAGLDKRFRDNTIRIFKRHGIQSVAYWHPADEPDSKDTLVYIIRHNSPAAAEKSWQGFRDDEEWQKVAKESQKDGAFLRERPESIYMKATDYSAIK